MQYEVEQLVRPARRDGNSIRPYLFVNPLQGKHIPVSPGDAVAMCRQAAELLNRTFPDDRLFIVGFAETATGIAASISSFLKNVLYYQNTTRENNGEDRLLFSEAHSHATDQFFRTAGTATALKAVDRVVFIDDEVTTGNTICNLIRLIQTRFHADGLRFTVLSVLNSMTDRRLLEMKEQGIDCLYLCRIPYEYGKESIMATGFDPRVHINARCGSMPRAAAYSFACPINPRNAVRFADYLSAVHAFAEEIRTRVIGSRYCESVLVLGTEEFMFPTFAVGEMIKRQGCAGEVKIHSTTRSPIIASGEGDYPLNCRYQIRSPYDLSRTTYVYNLRRYDRVIILTDARETPEGMNDLCNALRLAGSGDIAIAAWKYENGGEKI